MITEEQFKEATTQRDQAQATITEYGRQRVASFEDRWKRFVESGEVFSDEELRYAAGARCERCDAGLAYPKDCGGHHQWNCSAVLTGRVSDLASHAVYPFAFYEIKSEDQPSAYGATTRPKVS